MPSESSHFPDNLVHDVSEDEGQSPLLGGVRMHSAFSTGPERDYSFGTPQDALPPKSTAGSVGMLSSRSFHASSGRLHSPSVQPELPKPSQSTLNSQSSSSNRTVPIHNQFQTNPLNLPQCVSFQCGDIRFAQIPWVCESVPFTMSAFRVRLDVGCFEFDCSVEEQLHTVFVPFEQIVGVDFHISLNNPAECVLSLRSNAAPLVIGLWRDAYSIFLQVYLLYCYYFSLPLLATIAIFLFCVHIGIVSSQFKKEYLSQKTPYDYLTSSACILLRFYPESLPHFMYQRELILSPSLALVFQVDSEGRYVYNGAVGPYGSAYCYDVVYPKINKMLPKTLSSQVGSISSRASVKRAPHRSLHSPQLVTPPQQRPRGYRAFFSYLIKSSKLKGSAVRTPKLRRPGRARKISKHFGRRYRSTRTPAQQIQPTLQKEQSNLQPILRLTSGGVGGIGTISRTLSQSMGKTQGISTTGLTQGLTSGIMSGISNLVLSKANLEFDEDARRAQFESFQWKHNRVLLQTDRATAVITHAEEDDTKQCDSWLHINNNCMLLESSFYSRKRKQSRYTSDVTAAVEKKECLVRNEYFPLPVVDNVVPSYPWMYTLGSYQDPVGVTADDSAEDDDNAKLRASLIKQNRLSRAPWQSPRSPTWVDNVYVDCIVRLLVPSFVFNSWFQRFFSKFGLPLLYIYQAIAALLGGIAPSIFRALLTLFPWFREEFTAIHSVLRIMQQPLELFYLYILLPVLPLFSHSTYYLYLAGSYTISFFQAPFRLVHSFQYFLIFSIKEAARGVWSYYELATLRETLYLVWSQSVMLREWLTGISDTLSTVYSNFILQCSEQYDDVIVKFQHIVPTLYSTYTRISSEMHAGLMNTMTFLSRLPEFGLRFNLQLPFGFNLPLIIVNGAQDVASMASSVARSRLKQIWDVITNSSNFVFKQYQVRLKATQNRTVSEGIDSLARTLITEGGLHTEPKSRSKNPSRSATPFTLPTGQRRRLVSPTMARSLSNIRKRLVFSEDRKRRRTSATRRLEATPRSRATTILTRSSRSNTPGLTRPTQNDITDATSEMQVLDLNYNDEDDDCEDAIPTNEPE